MTLKLLSSDLLCDHERGLLSAHPCDDKVWLNWIQVTKLLTILPSRKVSASYWARLQWKKRNLKSNKFQSYFICPCADCPNVGEPFRTKRDVLQHLLSDHHDFDPDQMTFLDPIKVTDRHLHNEEDDGMEEASTTTQTYTPQAGSCFQKTSRHSPPLPHVPNTKTKLDMSVAPATSSAASSTKTALSAALAFSTPSEYEPLTHLAPPHNHR